MHQTQICAIRHVDTNAVAVFTTGCNTDVRLVLALFTTIGLNNLEIVSTKNGPSSSVFFTRRPIGYRNLTPTQDEAEFRQSHLNAGNVYRRLLNIKTACAQKLQFDMICGVLIRAFNPNQSAPRRRSQRIEITSQAENEMMRLLQEEEKLRPLSEWYTTSTLFPQHLFALCKDIQKMSKHAHRKKKHRVSFQPPTPEYKSHYSPS